MYYSEIINHPLKFVDTNLNDQTKQFFLFKNGLEIVEDTGIQNMNSTFVVDYDIHSA